MSYHPKSHGAATGRIGAYSLAVCLMLQPVFAVDVYKDKNAPVEERVADLLSRMTLEEKVSEMILKPYYPPSQYGVGGHGEKENAQKVVIHPDTLKQVQEGKVGAFLKANGVATNRVLQEQQMKHSRLGIPLMFHEDVVHGYRTILPVPIASACSWNDDAIEKAEAVAAREASASGLQLTYAPMVDVTSDPRWGRIMETSGEDPYLGARIAAARVRGFQGDSEKDLSRNDTIMGCVKHYAGYPSLEGGLDYYYKDFSWRDLQETYLPPFQGAIRAGVGSVMCSYTAYNGEPATFNRFLNIDVLRNQLGFKGLLVTDWNTLNHAKSMGASASNKESAERGIKGGIDMDMTSGQYMNLIQLVKEGKVPMKLIDQAVAHCLKAKFQTGLFDDPYRYFDEKKEKEILLSNRNKADALAITQESIILLQNKDNVLPLSPDHRVALTGWLADNGKNQLGSWDASGKGEESITVFKGMKEIWKDNLVSDSQAFTTNIPKSLDLIKDVDTVVVCLGENRSWSGEASNRATLELSDDQIEHLKAIKKAGKKIISIVFAGRPVIMDEIAQNSDAVLYAWFPGTMGGTAIAQLVSGEVNPSAKTCQTFPRHAGQIPVSYRWHRPFHYTGYSDMPRTPFYPFGFGMSYTTFNYSAPKTNKEEYAIGEPVQVTVKVANTGKRAGREIVQCYIRDEIASVVPRERELREYTSVDLQPGEEKEVTLTLPPSAFEIITVDQKRVIEPGSVQIFVGPDSTTQNKTSIRLAAAQ